MRGKISALTLLATLATLSCLIPAEAGADVHLAFGTKWQPLRYTTAAFPFSPAAGAGTTGGSGGSLSGFQSTSLDPYLALFFAQKYGVQLSLDIGYGTLNQNVSTGTNNASDSYFQFGASVGFKMYITQPRAGRVSPYVYADIFKYWAAISTSKVLPDGNMQPAFKAGLLSPVGGTFAFGAEYFVTPAFSVGSEVLGLKVASASADIVQAGTDTNQTYTYVTFYTGISLNYRFQVQAAVRSTDEDEQKDADAEAAPKKHKKTKPVPAEGDDATTPPTPPPPSPEAVD